MTTPVSKPLSLTEAVQGFMTGFRGNLLLPSTAAYGEASAALVLVLAGTFRQIVWGLANLTPITR